MLPSGKRTRKSSLIKVLRLSWPAMLEQLFLSLAGYVDTAMVGTMGVTATAAVAVNTSTMWLLKDLLFAVATGFTFLVARHTGANEPNLVKSSARHALLSAVVAGGALTLVVELLAGYWPRWLGAAPDVAPHATMYLRIVGSALLFQSLTIVLSSTLRGASDMKAPMIINAFANLTNLLANYLLIYPTREKVLMGIAFRMPGAGLGVEGAALGTALSYALSGTLLLFYLRKTPSLVRLSRKDRFVFDGKLIRQALRVAIPSALERGCMCFGQITLTSIIAKLGTVPLAAHHLAITAESLFYLASDGLARSAATLVGQSLGAKEPEQASRLGRITYLFGFVITCFCAVILFTCAEPLIRIFTSDAAVILQGGAVLRIMAFAEPFFAITIVVVGALYGAGDAKSVFLINTAGMWGIRLGLAYILGYQLGFGLSGVWVAMVIDILTRSALFILRFERGKWKTIRI